MTDYTVYNNPLITRYASKEMQHAFSDDKRFKLWRKLWIALAESEMELGLNVTQEQVDELKAHAEDIDYELAAKFEREVRHDVMAHVKAYGESAKTAKPIIHLGATSCFVNCNAEAIMLNDALDILLKKLVNVMDKLKNFALQYKDVPTLGFTHLQPAQLTTVGKRATLWLQDLEMDYVNLMHAKENIKLRGVKGTTGTQASFLELFNGDDEKVKELEKRVVAKLGYDKVYGVTGQTYPRKLDYNILCVLSQIAQSAYKFSNDLRILQSFEEMEEPFEKNQIGSSAMPYKRNPMRSERISALARYVIVDSINPAMTAGTQWFERTLDDSANKRISVAEAFLATDAILNIYINVTANLVVYPKVVERRVMEKLPFMATENIMMDAVKAGGNRQELHERLRVHSHAAARAVKLEGKPNDLIDRIAGDEAFGVSKEKILSTLDPKLYVGRSVSQVDEFVETVLDPILARYTQSVGAELKV